jgi:hypothetical protein
VPGRDLVQENYGDLILKASAALKRFGLSRAANII